VYLFVCGRDVGPRTGSLAAPVAGSPAFEAVPSGGEAGGEERARTSAPDERALPPPLRSTRTAALRPPTRAAIVALTPGGSGGGPRSDTTPASLRGRGERAA